MKAQYLLLMAAAMACISCKTVLVQEEPQPDTPVEITDPISIKRAFADNGPAEFYDMFEARPDTYFWINEVYQKSRLSVTEWGTEAASVTVVDMGEATSAGPGENEPKRLDFFCDHPFFFVIGEATSGVILFEGAYTGK